MPRRLEAVKCQNCGENGDRGARFCSACGAPFQTFGDERRVATVLFADLVGFTSLSESLDPEQVKQLVDSAFERLVADVHTFGGRVDKIVGDAIVALFGAPVAHEDDAERAVRAGLRMQETLMAFSDEVRIGIRMRVGVNTGEVLVGALRSGGDYTAMGDVVNTASRLQTSAAPGEVLVGPSTHQGTENSILYEPRGSVIVRGREQAIDVFAAIKATEAPGFRRRRLTAIVGRESELALAREALRLAVSNTRPTVMLILGEAGVGKTRLANEVVPLVGDLDPGVLELSGRCVPYGESNPWWPIADALRELIGISEDDSLDVARAKTSEQVARGDGAAHDPAAVTNGLLHVMGFDSPVRDLDPDKASAQAVASLLEIIERRDAHRPVVIRLADLHWASDAVFDFIDALLARVSRRSFIIVATARPSLLDRWSPPAVRGTAVLLHLDPLGDEASAHLLDSLISRPITAATRQVLVERAGGNPFFLEELATLYDAGSDLTPGSGVELPDTLRGLIAARIDLMSIDQQHVMEDAAVWGPSGPLYALDELSRATRGVPDVTEDVRALADLDILTLTGHDWAFRSDLVREVAYNRITKSERLARHAGIARYMASIKPGRFVDDRLVDVAARHFTEAARLAADIGAPDGDGDLGSEALGWLRESARRSEAASAWVHASRMYDAAIELVERQDDSPEKRRELLGLRLGRSHVLSERWDLAGARSDAEWTLAAAEGEDEIEIPALVRLGEIANRDGRLDEGRALLDQARQRAEAAGDNHALAESLRHTAMGDLFAGRLAEAESAVVESLGVYRDIGDRRGEAWALQNLAWIAFALGQIERAEARLLESEAAFVELSDVAGRSWALGLMAFVRFHQGRFDEARALGEHVLVEAERLGDQWGHGMVLIVLANVDLWEGRTRLASSLAQRAIEVLRTLDEPVGLEQALATAGRALAMSGDVDAGSELISEASRLRGGDAGPFEMSTTLLWSVLTQLGRADDIDAGELLRWDSQVVDDLGGAETTAVVALAHLQRGDVGAAAERLDRRVARLEVDGGGDDGAERPSFVAVRALVAAAAGDAGAVSAALAQVESSRPTYLDRLYALVAAALVGDRPARRIDQARVLVDSTEDVFAALLVDTVEAAISSDAPRGDWALVADRWNRAGGDVAGWARVIDAALAAKPAH